MEKTDIFIHGGGLAGLSLGVALALEGMAVTVADKVPLNAQQLPAFDGRVSAIALGSQRLLAAIGMWEHVEEAQPIYDIRVADGALAHLHYNHAEVGKEPFGWIVENRHSRRALARAAEALPNLTLLTPDALQSFSVNAAGVKIALQSGKCLQAMLLVGADGKESRTRLLADITSTRHEYGQTAIVCTIAHTQPHHGMALERFLTPGPFAALPMTGNRSSLVWTEKHAVAKHLLALPAIEFNQEINERLGGYLGEAQAVGARFAYPLSALYAARLTAPRVALVGDAGHAIHPLAGQGINLGFRDVAVLAELLADAKRVGADLGNAALLADYERKRALDTLALLGVTHGLNALFARSEWPVKLLRGLGLKGVSALPPLKKLFMRDAMGLTGDVPRLMRAA